ncbi:unnamed protein product [Dibothriocephalus latus]|uniref:Uncharacterized protein n=1 Tax=Dibothriocephalus latus TaxID=60516 RepID=A0A3P7P1K9_DIBLA|nr:unnamed protein product [Dibothriocephalus latus]
MPLDKATLSKCCLALTVLFSFLLQMPFSEYRSAFINDLDAVFYTGSSAILLFAVATTILELTLALLLRLLSFELRYLPSGPLISLVPTIAGHLVGRISPHLRLWSGMTADFLVMLLLQLVGLAYQYDLLGLQKVLFVPKSAVAAVSNGLGPWLRSTPPADLKRPLGATLELQHREELDRQEQSWMEARRASMNVTGYVTGSLFQVLIISVITVTTDVCHRRITPFGIPQEEHNWKGVTFGIHPEECLLCTKPGVSFSGSSCRWLVSSMLTSPPRGKPGHGSGLVVVLAVRM